jgi:hypothetical protein
MLRIRNLIGRSLPDIRVTCGYTNRLLVMFISLIVLVFANLVLPLIKFISFECVGAVVSVLCYILFLLVNVTYFGDRPCWTESE